ncbi:MAG: hypothetical protein HRT74_04705 [Flavobacteriales bacterium]|nr:hypothetical protein [Flavobacteriales bacterium]
MKRIGILILFCLFGFAATAQQLDVKDLTFRERLVFSGDVALQFGTFTFIGASPSVGYRVNNWLTAGVGAHYYYSEGFGLNNRIWGGQAFARARIFDGAFLMTEFHQTNTWKLLNTPSSTEEPQFGYGWVPLWYVGGGYFYNAGGGLRIGGSILFDVIDDPNSPWQNPLIRGGVIWGIR